jgi:hypothetical protein
MTSTLEIIKSLKEKVQKQRSILGREPLVENDQELENLNFERKLELVDCKVSRFVQDANCEPDFADCDEIEKPIISTSKEIQNDFQVSYSEIMDISEEIQTVDVENNEISFDPEFSSEDMSIFTQ